VLNECNLLTRFYIVENKTYAYLMNKGSACVDREIITCPPGVDDWYGDKYVANQIKFINQFFGGTGGLLFDPTLMAFILN
jgi:hypothetical protein